MRLVPILSDFDKFRTPRAAWHAGRNETSLYKGIPISLREDFLQAWHDGPRAAGGLASGIKLAYRGPRVHRRTGRGTMSTHNAQSYCLMADATSFAVYLR